MLADELKAGKWLLVNKPKGITSFGAVFAIRKAYQRITREKLKVGHAGTLDPLASGLLIICTGRETKNIDRFMGLPKTYTGTLVLGASTPSFDLETEPDTHFPTEHITPDFIRQTAQSFLGISHQIPPAFSAIKMGGKKAYDLARSGREVKMAPREIEITSFDVSDIRFPEVDFEITCSKGTYIRSIAHDFGMRMHSGAYLKELCRTAIGSHSLTEARTPEEWINTLFREQKVP
jgi:tRNA pseudouridine55 synthase